MRRLALVATVLSLLWACPAPAYEVRAKGTRLIIKDMSGTKKLVFLSKDPAVPFGAPVPGGPDDPSVVGATFTVSASNANGTEIGQFALPASGWTVQQTPTYPRFRFTNRNEPIGSPTRSAMLRGGLLKLKAEDSGISLDEPSQTVIGVRLDAGSMTWCSSFDTNIVQNEPGRFKAKAQDVAPAACVSTLVSPVCGNGTIEPGEQCDGDEFCNATCLIEATGCCQYGTAPGPFCSADIGIGATPSAIYVGCTQLNGTYLLGSVPSGTSLCAEAPEVTWLSGGPCQPLGPVAPTTLCCNAPDCIDGAVDDNADVSSFVRNCMYTVIQDPAPVVVGTCGPSGFCVPAH